MDFEQAYDEHLSRIYGFFAYRCSSRADAEDLTQQCFERALRAWDRYEPARAPVGAWLVSIARNLLIDDHRARSSAGAPVLFAQLDPDALTGDGDVAADLGLDPDLARVLGMLSARERELIALRYGADLNGPEIAALTGLTLANVQQILSRTLRRMRAELGGG